MSVPQPRFIQMAGRTNPRPGRPMDAFSSSNGKNRQFLVFPPQEIENRRCFCTLLTLGLRRPNLRSPDSLRCMREYGRTPPECVLDDRAFILPESSAMGTQHFIGLVSGEPFQRPPPSSRHHLGGDQQVDLIRHHDERMQLIAVKALVPI